MGQSTIQKTRKLCALCKHWNGQRGSDYIQPVPGGASFRIELSERQTCFAKGIPTVATQTCPKFVPRY